MNHSLIIDEVLAHPQDVSWLPWAVQYFFFIGIAACAALFACVLHWRKKETADLENLTLLIALTCAITAPLALTADLHQTARVWADQKTVRRRKMRRRHGPGCRGARCFYRCLPVF